MRILITFDPCFGESTHFPIDRKDKFEFHVWGGEGGEKGESEGRNKRGGRRERERAGEEIICTCAVFFLKECFAE